MPTPVVLDTNALLLPFERRLRIEAEIERLLGPFEGLVPAPCIRELERIARDERGARRDRAKMALEYARRFTHVPAEGAADTASLALAQARGAHLFTNDAALVKRARALGVPVIRLRGLSHLIVETSGD